MTPATAIPGASCVRRELDAMGVTVELLLAHGDADGIALLDEAEDKLDRLEQIFSRFVPDSELSALNRAGALDASTELFEVVSLAVDARERTGGRFDPTVHAAVVAAGYDRTFEDVPRESPAAGSPAGARCGGAIQLDPARRRIELEEGFQLDLGGIAKGWSADRVCALLSRYGPCLVNAGGDLTVSGTLGDAPWPVAIDVPGTSLTLGISAGGLATSGSDERRWRRGDTELHHLIDPASGRPSRSDLVRVTAAADSAAAAEVAAKSLFLAGERAAVAEADALGIPCVLVTADGRAVLAGGLS